MLIIPGDAEGKAAAGGAFRMQRDRHVQQPSLDTGEGSFLPHRHAVVGHGVLPQALDFPDRALHEASVFHPQLPGYGHLRVPGMTARGFLAGFPVVHPADHDPPAVRGQEGLGGVEIEAVVDRLDRPALKAAVLFVPVSQEADGAEARVELLPGVHFLRADQQNLFAVQREKVRAFPHPAVLAGARVDLAHEAPVQPVRAFQQHDRALPGLVAVAGHHAVHAVPVPPDLGVSEIKLAVTLGQVGVTDDGVQQGLFKVRPVPHGDALSLGFPAEGARGLDAGVDQHQLTVRHFHGAAGKAAAGVRRRVRRQGAGHVRPVH